VVDAGTKPSDVYAVPLTAGTTYKWRFTSNNNFGGRGFVNVRILSPDGTNAVWAGNASTNGCGGANSSIPCTYSPAVTAIFLLSVDNFGNGQRYTFTINPA
jgi:hypothetical protein